MIFKKINSKYFYIGSTILMLIIIFIFSTKNKIITTKNNNTEPIIPTQSIKSSKDIALSDVIPAANTTPFNLGNYSIKNKKLIFTLPEGNGYEVDTNSEPVSDFKINGNSLIITTGEVYSTPSAYYIHDITTANTYKMEINKVKPIVDITAFSDIKNVYLLGSYKNKNYTMSLYSNDLTTGKNSLILSNISRNYLKSLDNDNLILGKEIDKSEPNFYFDVYDAKNTKYLKNNVLTAKKTICSNNDSVFYLNYKDNKIIRFNYKKIEENILDINIDSGTPLTLCDDNRLTILQTKENKIKIQNVFLNKPDQSNNNEFSLKDNQLFIEAFLNNGTLIFKFYDKTDRSYTLVKEN